jgi:hypothetical protein
LVVAISSEWKNTTSIKKQALWRLGLYRLFIGVKKEEWQKPNNKE